MSSKINRRLLANKKTDNNEHNLHNNICSRLEDKV